MVTNFYPAVRQTNTRMLTAVNIDAVALILKINQQILLQNITSVPTSQKTHCPSITKVKSLEQFRTAFAVYRDN